MPTLSKPCLLVVDDETEVCESVYHLLHRKYHVLRATTAEEAGRLMKENKVHIIMTDQRMPGMTGVEILQQVKTQHPEAVRMLFTGYADVHSVVAAINQGHVYRYLTKPWQPEELEAAVADAALEYDRIVRRAKDLMECITRLTSLEKEQARLQERLSELEQENRRLSGLLKP